MKLAPLVLALGLLPGCAVNLSGRDEPDAETLSDVPTAPCRTAAPDPADFEGDFTLGIITDDSEVYLDAWPRIEGHQLSVTVQSRDPETDEPMGDLQLIDAGSFDVAGRFAIDEVVLDLPAPDGDKAGLADVEGGFCLRSNSIQGTFEGWSFAPNATPTGGYWFIARDTR